MSTKNARTISTKNMQYFKETRTLLGTMEEDYGFTHLMHNTLSLQSHVTGNKEYFFLREETDTAFIFDNQYTHGSAAESQAITLKLVKSFK